MGKSLALLSQGEMTQGKGWVSVALKEHVKISIDTTISSLPLICHFQLQLV